MHVRPCLKMLFGGSGLRCDLCSLRCGRQAAARLAALASLNRAVHLATYNRLIGEEALALRAGT